MATASLPVIGTAPRSPRTALGRGSSAAGAAVLSVIGSIVAIGVIGLGLLAVPIAAIVVFGPALLELL